jgi:hypothetical protein
MQQMLPFEEKLPEPKTEAEESEPVALEECSALPSPHVCETPTIPSRVLKIEEDGDFWRGNVKPKIRIKGRWLERAGFKAGAHVSVTCVAAGVIELRSPQVSILNEASPATPENQC